MKVLINDGLATSVKLTGIGHHAVQLWMSIRNLVTCDITNYTYLKKVPRVLRRFTYNAIANMEVLYQEYDIIHYQNHYAPFVRSKCKKVVTVHDLVAFRFPNTLPIIYRKYNQHAITSALKHCDAIFTRSTSIKEEILSSFASVKESSVFVCDGGLRKIFIEKISQDDILRKHQIDPYSYFLYVGDLTRRKNLSFLLESFIKAKKNNQIKRDTLLLLIGKQAWGTWDFKHLLREDEGIKTVGYLPDEDLCSFYKFSKGVIYPSIYEGYGLPLLEAMSQGAPIIISDIPTNREINMLHANQMEMFELGDSNGLIQLLETFDRQSEQIRSKLNYGDLTQYLYENVARRHVEIYQKILS